MSKCETMSRRSFADYDDDDTVSRRDAAALLGVSARTLEKWAQTARGPEHVQYGERSPVRYRIGDLRAYIQAHRRRSTTRGAGPAHTERE
jgi:hypothetical protein